VPHTSLCVHTSDTQPRQHHTYRSVCKVVLCARASARRCVPASPILFKSRLCGWREQRDNKNSRVTIITIDCVWLFSRRLTRLALTGTHRAAARLDRHLLNLASASHKLMRMPDTQSQQQHTNSSVCKVVFRARASARCCTPASPMLLSQRLCGWRELQDQNSMVTIITIDLCLASPRPTRLALTGNLASARLYPHSAVLSCRCSTRLFAHYPAPTAIHSHKRLQGRVARQGLCKMLRPGIADVVPANPARVT
jgi:hypothetical protein